MKWVTRERVKVDRVACPWLIRKFIDRQAEFLFMPADKVPQVGTREGAVPFDVPGVDFGHHGKECSFEALVKKYQLGRGGSTLLLAKVVNVSNVLIQKSLREGFGLVVSEILWKGTPIVGVRAGGIPLQL
jgi:hypothetical protein